MSGPPNTESPVLTALLQEFTTYVKDTKEANECTARETMEAILATVRAKQEALMKEVYTIMSATLGVPPNSEKKFVWDFYDKDGKPHHWEGTPKDFYKTIATNQYKVTVLLAIMTDLGLTCV